LVVYLYSNSWLNYTNIIKVRKIVTKTISRIITLYKLEFKIMNRYVIDYKENNLDSINFEELLIKIILTADYS
jgi:hypothetical protein